MKRVLLIFLMVIFVTSMLFMGISCKEEVAEEEVVEEEVVEEEGAEEEVAEEEVARDEDGKIIGIGNLAMYDTMAEFEEATGKKITAFNEAPEFKDLVAKNELPPVEERLPANPQIIVPIEEIGVYGGGYVQSFTDSHNRAGDASYLSGAETLVRTSPDLKSVLPNIAESWTVNDELTSITFNLKEGIKWSDGVPFTADDFMFFYNDWYLNTDFNPTPPSSLGIAGGPMEIVKIDDYTIVINFVGPAPTALTDLAHYRGYSIYMPAHYLKQFHIDYNPDADKDAKEAGFETWTELFLNKYFMGFFRTPLNPDMPTIQPYMCKEYESSHKLLVRNPYYWKVDSEGNQLPYLDGIMCTQLESAEMFSGKIVSGEYDFAIKHPKIVDLVLFQDAAEEHGYIIEFMNSLKNAQKYYQPNQTVADPVLREIFQDLRFRTALSIALDREEINETLYFGLGTITQFTSSPFTSTFYEPWFSEVGIEFDLEEANRLLDEMGLVWDDNEEYRIMSDGRRLGFTLEIHDWDDPKVHELVIAQWRDVGIDISIKVSTWAVFHDRVAQNLTDMSSMSGGNSTDSSLIGGGSKIFPTVTLDGSFGQFPAWSRWLIMGEDSEGAEEPPDEVKEIYNNWKQLTQEIDPEKQVELGKSIVQFQADTLHTIATIGYLPRIIVYKEHFKNFVPEPMAYGTLYYTPYHPEHIFIKK